MALLSLLVCGPAVYQHAALQAGRALIAALAVRLARLRSSCAHTYPFFLTSGTASLPELARPPHVCLHLHTHSHATYRLSHSPLSSLARLAPLDHPSLHHSAFGQLADPHVTPSPTPPLLSTTFAPRTALSVSIDCPSPSASLLSKKVA
jgi:hypothetical protein